MAERRLIVQILGDPRSLLKAFTTSRTASREFGASVTKANATLQASAKANVTALALERKELRQLALTYGQVASASVKGSDESIAALELQRRAVRQLKAENTGLAATVGGFGRNLAAGAGFIGAAAAATALGEALRTGVQNAAQLENSSQAIGVQFGTAADRVKEFASNSTGLGISAVESEKLSVRLGILIQNLGIGKERAADMTIGLQQLAGSIAEIKGISFESVAQNLPQALAGNLRSLKQLGFAFSQAQIKAEALKEGLIGTNQALTPGAKAQAIYALATRNLAGFLDQAERSSHDLANQQHILNAQVSNLETSMGDLVTGPLAHLTKGLADAAGGAQKLAGALGKIGNVAIPGKGSAFGEGFRKGFEGAIAPGLTLLGLINQINDAGNRKPAGKPAQAFIDAINKIRRDAAGGAADIGNRAAQPPHPINITRAQRNQFFDAAVGRAEDRVQDVASIQGQISALQKISAKIQQRIAATKDITRKLTLESELLKIGRQETDLRNQFFDDAIGRREDRVQDIKTVQGQIAALQSIAGEIQQRISVTKDVTRKLKLEDDLASVFRQIKSGRQQLAQNLTDALGLSLDKAQATAGLADDLAALAKINANLRSRIKAEGETTDLARQLFENQQATQQALIEQRNRRQFKSLSLGPTGGELIPLKSGLARELKQITEKIPDTVLDTAKNRKMLKAVSKLVLDPFTKISLDVRSTIKQMLDDLLKQLKDAAPKTKTTGLNANRIIQNITGLTPEQIRQLRASLSSFNSAGVGLAGIGASGGAFGFTGDQITGSRTETINVVVDGKKMATATRKHHQRHRRRNPPKRRGPGAGF